MDSSPSDSGQRQEVDALGQDLRYGANRPFLSGQNTTMRFDEYNIPRFISTKLSHDQPWDPLRHNAPEVSMDSQPNQFLHAGTAFHNFRNHPIPMSETDTNPDDSGYCGSRNPGTMSIENVSVYNGDCHNPEAQKATQMMEAWNLSDNHMWQPPPPPSSIEATPNGSDPGQHCRECGQWLRTRSEAKKHSLKHNKPFYCNVSHCHRIGGFSTRNDLDRHKRSVHADSSVSGRRFICTHGPCASKGKVWPRADNFRSHLSRIHNIKYSAEDDLKEYAAHQSPSREDLQGVGASTFPWNGDSLFPSTILGTQAMSNDFKHGLPQMNADLESLTQNSLYKPVVKDRQTLAPVHEDDETLQASNLPSGTGQACQKTEDDLIAKTAGPAHDSFSCSDFKEDSPVESDASGVPCDEMDMTGAQADPPTGSIMEQDEEHDCGPLSDDSDTGESVPANTASQDATAEVDTSSAGSTVPDAHLLLDLSQLETKNEDDIVAFLKQKIPKVILERAIGNGDSAEKSIVLEKETSAKNQNWCGSCNKNFNRPCELKKHMKRHTKPYGCTFRDCQKSFGSKNDWKRHESIQHWQLETWKCEELKSGKPDACEKVCLRRESFRHHLQKEHNIGNQSQLDEKLDKCRIGRHCDKRYWCGFCAKTLKVGDERANAWNQRCNHIDDHFSGRHGPKKNISEWLHLSESDDEAEKRRQLESTSPCSSSSSSPTSRLDTDGATHLKRKTDAERSAKSNKRRRQKTDVEYMWSCCACSDINSFKVNADCIQCAHKRCQACQANGHELLEQSYSYET